MINSNYAQAVTQAKANNDPLINFDNNTPAVQPIPGEKDTVTLSDRALAMMNGAEVKETAPTYVKPVTARALLAASDAAKSAENNTDNKTASTDNRFAEIMQNILNQRLGIDTEKLKEIEAKMELIANDESMSPEEKQEALEALVEEREKVMEKGKEVRELAEETD